MAKLHPIITGEALLTPSGQLVFQDLPLLQQRAGIFKQPDQPITLEVSLSYPTKLPSNQQKRFYRGVVVPFVMHLLTEQGWAGLNRENTHQMLIEQFNQETLINEQTGEVKNVAASSTRLSKDGWVAFIDAVRAWCQQEFGTEWPDTDEFRMM